MVKHVSRVTSANAWCQVFSSSSRARDLFSHGGKIVIERSESKDLEIEARPLDKEFIEVVKEEKSGCNRHLSVTFSNETFQ